MTDLDVALIGKGTAVRARPPRVPWRGESASRIAAGVPARNPSNPVPWDTRTWSQHT